MATQRSPSMLGNIRGGIDNVILSEWRGIFVVKKAPSKLKKKNFLPIKSRAPMFLER